MNHWVIQLHRGLYSACGPYKTSEACHRRWQRVKGGEVYEFESLAESPEDAIADFKAASVGAGG